MYDDDERRYRCRATVRTRRCDWTGSRAELRAHAVDAVHPLCVVCALSLAAPLERQTCERCLQVVRDDLDAVVSAYDRLEAVIEANGWRGGQLLGGDALTMAVDGNVDGLRPYRLVKADVPVVEVVRPAIGAHAGFVERRVFSDAREHFADHWRSDPSSVLAVLEANERDWRHEFGHGPAVDVATVQNCAAYLREWNLLAARTHSGFDDYAATVRELRSRLEHVVGVANDPERAPAPCFDCGGRLVREYRPAGNGGVRRRGFAWEGKADDWTCEGCGVELDQQDYFWRLRLATHVEGWVSVELAAKNAGRPEPTVWSWVRLLEVPSACHRLTRRIVVWWPAVQERSAVAGRASRRSA